MEQSLLEYPCDFPIKILGQTQAGFAQAVLEIVQRHAPDFDGGTVSMKTSKRGKYRASPASYALRANSSTVSTGSSATIRWW